MDELVKEHCAVLAKSGLHCALICPRYAATALRAFAEREKELVEALENIAKVPRSEAAYAIVQIFARDALAKHKATA